MERWNELERCRDPIVMCSAKIVNRAVYELIDIAAHKEKTIWFWPSFVLILSLIRYDYVFNY